MHRIRFKLLCFCTIFFSIQEFQAQKNEPETLVLKDYIGVLTDKFDLKFTYLDSYTESIITPVKSNSIQEILNALQRQVQLRFEYTESNNILIRPFNDRDIVKICGITKIRDSIQSNIEIHSTDRLKTVVSNKKGYFEIVLPYTSSIVFSLEDKNVLERKVGELYKVDCPDVNLNIKLLELEEIELWQYLTKGFERQAHKTVFKPKKFTVLAGLTEPDVMQSLQHIPSVQNPFETASDLHVRGGTPDQNLVLWNGIKNYNSGHFFGLISSFNPNLIKEIDFYSKGVNAEFGDRVAGVIDLKSSEQVTSKFEGGVGANLINVDAFARVPIIKDKLSVEVAGRRSFNDIWESPTFKQMAKRVFQNTKISETALSGNNSFYFVDYNIGIQAKLSKKDNLQLNTLYTKNDLMFENSSDGSVFKDNLITESEGYSLQWQRKYSETLSQKTRLNISNYILDYSFDTQLENNTESFKEDIKQNFVGDIGAKTFGVLKFNAYSNFQLGYEFSRTEIRYKLESRIPSISIVFDEDKSKLDTHSIFSQYEFKSKNNLLFQLGVRANEYSVSDKLFIEPRLYFQVPVMPNLHINSSVSFRSQATTQIQESVISSLSLENQLWRITNDEFDVLKTRQVSIGASYSNREWFIEVDSYVKRTNNITSLATGFLAPSANNSMLRSGMSSVEGAELFVKRKFKNYASWMSYTFNNQKNRFESLNDSKSFISNFNINHTFKWLHFYKYNDFQFSLSWLWHSGKATTDADSIIINGNGVELININEENLPVYHKLDASVLYDFKFSTKLKYQVGLSVLNIYNRRSIINREFKSEPGISKDFVTLNYEALGITPNLSLRVLW